MKKYENYHGDCPFCGSENTSLIEMDDTEECRQCEDCGEEYDIFWSEDPYDEDVDDEDVFIEDVTDHNHGSITPIQCLGIEQIIEGLDLEDWDDELLLHLGEHLSLVVRAAIAKLKTHPDAQPNKPLTENQLEMMDGQPVWLDINEGMWALVEACGPTLKLWLDRGGHYDARRFIGKIYRRPPKKN